MTSTVEAGSLSRRWPLLLAAAAGTLAWTGIVLAVLHHAPLYPRFTPLSDLGEHLRDAGILWHGGDPYGLRPTLNDTTPPFTVLIYTPLRPLHGALLEWIYVAINLLALSLALGAGVARLSGRRLLEGVAFAALILSPLSVLVLSQAAYSGLWWGQDQILMMSFVAIDLLIVRPRFRGLLIGIAAGVLLSPAIFVVLVARVGWLAVARVAGAFAGTVLVGMLVDLHASATYWLHLLPSGEAVRRVFILGGSGTGTVGTPANASLEAVLARRPFVHHLPLTASWIVLAGLLGLLSLAVAWVAQGRGLDLTAMTIIGLASAALSPVGWDHHWIWGVMIPLVVVELFAIRRWLAVVWALAIPLALLRGFSPGRHVHLPLGLTEVAWYGAPTVAFVVLLGLSAWVILRRSEKAAPAAVVA